MFEQDDEAKKLLVQIANCDIARRHVEDPTFVSPCSTIVATQEAKSWVSFQVPEPWSGHLADAPILFLSSNPSISENEAYPKGDDPIDLASFFDSRFEGHWSRDGKPLNRDMESYGTAVRYWSSIRGRATELLGYEAQPGVDYALSEIVHCKSRKEVGVRSALKTCADRYLMKVLAHSGAVVIVLVGKAALDQWNSLHSLGLAQVPGSGEAGLQEILGRKRMILTLPHPSSFVPKTFAACLLAGKIEQARSFIWNSLRSRS